MQIKSAKKYISPTFLNATKIKFSVHKGDRKPTDAKLPGNDLKDHFRIEVDDPQLEPIIRSVYGNTPNSLNIFLAYAKTFTSFYEGTENGNLFRCDGETKYEKLTKIERYDGVHSRLVPTNDPCHNDGEGKCELGCKVRGILYFYLQELQMIAPNSLGVLYVSGIHDILDETTSIPAQLKLFEEEFGSANLADDAEGMPPFDKRIPYRLYRQEKTITKPKVQGKKRTGEQFKSPTWIISISPSQGWYAAYQAWKFYKTQHMIENLPMPVKYTQALNEFAKINLTLIANTNDVEEQAALPETKATLLPASEPSPLVRIEAAKKALGFDKNALLDYVNNAFYDKYQGMITSSGVLSAEELAQIATLLEAEVDKA